MPIFPDVQGCEVMAHMETGQTVKYHTDSRHNQFHGHHPQNTVWASASLTFFTTVQTLSFPSASFPGPVQFSSVTQLCLTLCDPMNCSTPGLPVHHHLPEFTQTHVHRVSDAIQPSRPLSSPSPPAPNPSQHQSLFQ